MVTDTTTILECRGVVKRFGALAAVDGVDFTVQRGEVVGVGGPNGAGKTTFFDLISGLTPTTEGAIKLLGQDITGTAPHKLCHLGMARTFQLNSGFDHMSVFENVLVARAFGRRSSGGLVLTKQQDKEMARALLSEIGLDDIAAEKVAGIPILARKKLMVATALMNEPEILLLDEPVGGLTPPEIDEFIDLMLSLKSRGMTLVFIEHVMRFLTTVADRAVMMHQGKVIYDGAPDGLASDKTVSEVYLGSSGLGDAA
ncbi:ABC transporter ATP-binding protein [Roseovarius aestuarii]|uniref:Lipopolysaccharide export system ATP-binding protein LptB n=1 Tax=Roseovarius aestuarii TaxID=475083 RepID=A0A1X7BY09_9RHOB|nr:ABC transporter ATP-binding protein [Roseovarius aestuarii]SMC14547.1 Lipopolysaccharide export system ATP-binding protein LptB [Roseovarius aestuarii]